MQRAGFRTRGLPGLNAVEAPAHELEPYVESVYPGATGLLYRREPVVLAFDERFSTLLPVDRTPVPGRSGRADPAARVGARGRAGRRLAAVGADRRLGRRPPRHGATAPARGRRG